MSERETPETDAAIIEADGAWTFALKNKMQSLERERDEARELSRDLALDLQDCLKVTLNYLADVRRHFGETYVWDSLVNEDTIEQCEVSLAKSKEVLP
jgi:hypothetical protein